MISLNTYSFGYLMGLIKKDAKCIWNFDKFMEFTIKNNINCIEFPIDYFRRKEKKNWFISWKNLRNVGSVLLLMLKNWI